MLTLWWAKFSPALPSVPQVGVIWIIYQNPWQAGHHGCSKKKRAFLAVREAWNHLVSTGITQMDKLWVGILILEKHLSLERELLLTHSLFQSLSSLLHHTTPPSILSSICFWPFGCFFLCVFFCLCSHLIWSANVLSCFSKHLLGVHNSLALLPEWDENKPGRSFCLIMITVRLPAAVCVVLTWGSYFHSISM